MKKFGLYSFLVAALLITGCSQKEMTVEDTTMEDKTAVEKMDEIVVVEPQEQQESVLEEVVYVMDEVADDGVYVTINGERVFLKNIYFAFNKFDITPEMREAIKQNAMLLADYDGVLRIEGNCDDWGTIEYNYALGLKRANAVKNALVAEGLNPNNIKLISYGESNPVCTENTQACWQKNRRAAHRLNR